MIRGGRPRRWRAPCLAIAVAVLHAGCDEGPGGGLGRSYFDDEGRFSHAGVSTRVRAAVQPYAPEAFGPDTATRAFHLFRARCSSCHEAPDPRMRTAEHWGFLVPRMVESTRKAGVIPMSQAEADSILDLLRRHARR